jgi:hypothetical protein
MMSVWCNNCHCERLQKLIEDTKLKAMTHLTNEHLKGCTEIVTEIISDIERLLKENQYQISY